MIFFFLSVLDNDFTGGTTRLDQNNPLPVIAFGLSTKFPFFAGINNRNLWQLVFKASTKCLVLRMVRPRPGYKNKALSTEHRAGECIQASFAKSRLLLLSLAHLCLMYIYLLLLSRLLVGITRFSVYSFSEHSWLYASGSNIIIHCHFGVEINLDW